MELDTDFINTVLAIVIPLCIAVAYIVRLEMRVKQLEKNNSNDDPLTKLKQRFAEGKITPEEFEEAKKKLE